LVSRYQNVSILDFIGAKCDGGGGNNWSYKMCKAPVKMSPPTNQHPAFIGQMPFLSSNQQCQSTEGKITAHYVATNDVHGRNNEGDKKLKKSLSDVKH